MSVAMVPCSICWLDLQRFAGAISRQLVRQHQLGWNHHLSSSNSCPASDIHSLSYWTNDHCHRGITVPSHCAGKIFKTRAELDVGLSHKKPTDRLTEQVYLSLSRQAEFSRFVIGDVMLSIPSRMNDVDNKAYMDIFYVLGFKIILLITILIISKRSTEYKQ